jgi:hypothetical protein
MKISHYNQLLAISTLLSGMLIFTSLWHQYQKVEKISRAHYESRLLVQTIEHVSTMSQLWLTTQDLLFSGQQTYLAKGIIKQSEQLKKILLNIKPKLTDGDHDLVQRLILGINTNDEVVNSFSHLSANKIKRWQLTVAESDEVTTLYVSDLEILSNQISNENNALSNQVILATSNFNKLSYLVISLYILLILFTVSCFSKYIVKPIENITALAQNPIQGGGELEFRQKKAATEIITLSGAIQQFTEHITIEKKRAEQEQLNVIRANDKANVIMDTIPCAVLLVDEQGLIKECNIETEKLLLSDKGRIINSKVFDYVPALATLEGQFDSEIVLSNMEESLLAPSFDNPHIEFSGRRIVIDGQVSYLLTLSDINERKHSQKALSSLNEQLINAEKLASIGQLSAGIAHEINNPVGYIRSNLDVLNDYVTPLMTYINLTKSPQKRVAAEEYYHKEDLTFILEDISPLISSTLEGAARVSKIIKDLGNYAHVYEKLP